MVAQQAQFSTFLHRDNRVPPRFHIERGGLQNREIPAQPIQNLRFAPGPGKSSSAGSAHCTGVPTDKYVSAIISNRPRASALFEMIHASFICGSPTVFESPFNTNTGTSSQPCKVLTLS